MSTMTHTCFAQTLGVLMKGHFLIVVLTLALAGCSSPKPILYPNAHYQRVGPDAAKLDIEECRDMAKTAGATPSQGKTGQVATSTGAGGAVGAAAGAVGGAVLGRPGRGAAVGAASGTTAGFLRGLFRKSPPSKTYIEFVDRCLRERGYEPTGWE